MGCLCFLSVPSYGILIGWQSVCPLADCFSYQWHISDPFFLSGQATKIVSSLTAGDPADWTSVCPGEDLISGRLLDLFWWEMTPARDTKRWSGNREKKGSVQVTGCFSKIYCATTWGSRSVCTLSFESHSFLMATHHNVTSQSEGFVCISHRSTAATI